MSKTEIDRLKKRVGQLEMERHNFNSIDLPKNDGQLTISRSPRKDQTTIQSEKEIQSLKDQLDEI